LKWYESPIIGAVINSRNTKISYNECCYRYPSFSFVEGKDICQLRMGSCGSVYANECTLIARPIEDMTDEEKKEYNRILKGGFNYQLIVEAEMYLLQQGIWKYDTDRVEFRKGQS
jgi:hypothetical protein